MDFSEELIGLNIIKKEGTVSTTPRDPAEIKMQNIKNFFVFIVFVSLIAAFTVSHIVELNLNSNHIKAIKDHHCSECLLKLFPKFKRKPEVEIKISPLPELKKK